MAINTGDTRFTFISGECRDVFWTITEAEAFARKFGDVSRVEVCTGRNRKGHAQWEGLRTFERQTRFPTLHPMVTQSVAAIPR